MPSRPRWLLLLLLPCILCDCPATYNPRDIFTGFFLASTVANVDLNINQTTSTYSYALSNPFTANPQVAITTSVIEGPMRSDQYYRLSVNSLSNQLSFVLNMSYTSNNWQYLRVDFMAASRPDMQLGVYQAVITQYNSDQLFRTTLTKQISNPVVVTFIAGFEVSPQNFNINPLSLTVSSAESAGNSLNVSINTNFVKVAYISYIVYDSSSLQKAYIVSQGSAGLGISSANNSLFQAGTTSLFGFNRFTSPSNTYFDYSSRMSSLLSINVTTKTLSSIAVSFIIIQNLPTQYCITCNSGGIYQDGYCVVMCDSSSIPATQNGAQTCVVCDIQQFMVKTPDNTSCVCAVQYYQPAGNPGCIACNPTCVTCKGPYANNCTSCDLTPSLGANRVLVNGACQCINKYYSTSSGYSCLPCHYSCLTCSGDGASSCLSCSVNVGRTLSGNMCTCRAGYTDNGQNQTCVCTSPLPNGNCSVPLTCQQNQVIVNNTCQCSSGFFNISGQCTQCASNQYFNQGACTACANGQVSSNKTQCVCNSGFYKIGGTCQQCKANQVYSNSSKTCACASGSYLVNGTCQRPPANQVYNGSAFVCSTGFYNISGTCSTCQGNQVYNSTTQTCGCARGLVLVNRNCQVQTNPGGNTNQTNNTNNGTSPTTCPANSVFNGQTCMCVNGYYNISGNCTTCPTNAYFNGQSCACYPGYYNISGSCTNNPTCPGPYQYFNGVTCICYPGYTNISGTCTYGCGQNQVLTQAGCQCANGYYNISGNCTACPQNSFFNGVSCVCPNGLYLINNTCASCGLNAAYNGSACVCSQGTYNISGSCQPCSTNSNYNGSACICNSGYTMSQNSCVPNPPANTTNTTNPSNTTSNQSSQCGFGNWNGYQCVCNQGYYLIQGKCAVCPNGAYFNGQTCICYGGTSYINGVCTTCPNYSYFNGVTCACYGGLVYTNNVCLPCPQGSYNTGTTCTCYSGTYSSQNNTCITCNPPATFNGTSCVCPTGYYLQQNNCMVCSRGCAMCTGPNNCTTCNNGFNLNNGVCTQGSTGGSTGTNPGNPSTGNSNKVNLTNQGYSLYPGYVVAAITLSPFPTAIQANNCMLCGNVLQTTIVTGTAPQILAGYSPPSTLYILFGFGTQQPRPFVASVGVNPQYASYFLGMDISTKLTLNVTQDVINGRG